MAERTNMEYWARSTAPRPNDDGEFMRKLRSWWATPEYQRGLALFDIQLSARLDNRTSPNGSSASKAVEITPAPERRT